MRTDSPTARVFVEQSRRYLADEYLPKIERCLMELSDEQIWWRPNEVSNSVGNLILHLAGNIRQWIISGVGGLPDVRQRQQEFDERHPISREDLRARIRSTLEEVDRVLATVDHGGLLAVRHIQGREVTALQAIYHAVEHFAMHTGQILYVTKSLTGHDLGFYEIRDGVARRRW